MSVIDKYRPSASNRGFLRALLAAVVFMLLSGAILLAGFLTWHYPQLAEGAKTKPITLTGKDFYIAIGKGGHEGNALVLKSLDDTNSAVISSKKALFNASKYPVVEYRITGRTPGAAVVLYWRTVTHNKKTLFGKLHWNGDHLSAYNMSNQEEWEGPVTEMGISVSGDLRNQPITIEQITFSPWTVQSLLLTVWTEWNAFEGWTQKSINAIRGMPKHALISPVVAAAAWCGLAIMLYTLWLLFHSAPKVRFELEVEEANRPIRQMSASQHSDASRHPDVPRRSNIFRHTGECRNPRAPVLSIARQIWDFKIIVIMFMIAWFALDGKWQVNLWRQLDDTKYLFAGKSYHEQHLAAEDAVIYTFAADIKKLIQQPQSDRIFLLRDKLWRDGIRSRLMYYLYPYNVSNYLTFPDIKVLKNGDYVLQLGSYDGQHFSISDGQENLLIELVKVSDYGVLYRVSIAEK